MSFARLQLAFTQKDITQLIADSIKRAGLLELTYTADRKSIRLPVEAYHTQSGNLYTEGFTTLGKARIMGKLRFKKIWEDSLANNLNSPQESFAPFTYFARKAGRYERQNIDFQAGFSYPIFKSLYLTSDLNYKYHWSTGSVDPRPDIKVFTINYAPGLTMKIGKTSLGAHYSFGKSEGLYDIVYKNTMFSQSQLYPERKLYMNNGYGYTAQYTSEIYSDSKAILDGWQVSMATGVSNWLIKAIYANKFAARTNFNLINPTDEDVNDPVPDKEAGDLIRKSVHSRYDLATQTLESLIYNVNSSRVHQFFIDGSINEGTGLLMSSPTGANYLFDEHRAKLQYLLSVKTEKKLRYELGFSGEVYHLSKKDFLASHFYENTTAELALSGGKYIYTPKSLIKINIRPAVVKPVKNELTVPPTQINVFTRTIAYPEFDFRGSTFFSGEISLLYYTQALLKRMGSAFSLNAGLMHRLQGSHIDEQLYIPPTGSKKQISISIGFQIFL
ncbi:hypothetical protein GCM10027051_02350 [Niabella terrae]